MNHLARWVRATFDYNPVFPLSALALLIGVRFLAAEGGEAQGPLAEALFASGILHSYEALLLLVALAILWPRRIAYETSVILKILGVVRFAAPFLAARLAGEGQLGAALALGAFTWVVGVLKVEVAARQLSLDWSRRERLWDALLFGLGCVGLPWFAQYLAAETGASLDHATARLLQVGAWWGLALVLAPLAFGPESLGVQSPLASRRSALVWRGVTCGGLILLAVNALWIGGGLPSALALFPLGLVVCAIAAHILRAWGASLPGFVAHAPAALLVLAGLQGRELSAGLSVGRVPALAALALISACALPLLVRAAGERRRGARSLALVCTLAPLTTISSSRLLLLYALAVSGVCLVWSLYLQRDREAAWAGLIGAGILFLLGGRLPTLAVCGAVLALASAWRLRTGRALPAVSFALSLAPGALAGAQGNLAALPLLAYLGAAGAAGVLAWQRDSRALKGLAGATGALLIGRYLLAGARPGPVLLGMAFGGIPLGTWLALRREVAARAADDALLTDPRFEAPEWSSSQPEEVLA